MSEIAVKNIDQEEKPPKYVRKYNKFMEKSLLREPTGLVELTKRYPELQMSFGKTDNSYYITIKLRLEEDSAFKREMPWHETPIADHTFVFTVEPDGSLTRLIDVRPAADTETDTDEQPAGDTLISVLGKKKAKEFTRYITGKQSGSLYDIQPFLDLDDIALDSIADIHTSIANRQTA